MPEQVDVGETGLDLNCCGHDIPSHRCICGEEDGLYDCEELWPDDIKCECLNPTDERCPDATPSSADECNSSERQSFRLSLW